MTNYYLTKEVAGFDDFCKIKNVRDHIIAHAENRDIGIEAVAKYIQRQWLFTKSHARDSLLTRLMQQGYSSEQILLSLADAWVNESDRFKLPKRGFIERWGKSRIAFIFSITVVLVLTILYALYLFHYDYPRFENFFWIASIASTVMSWLLYEVIMFIWSMKGE